jgi:ubiquinone/menaquinone biosynthesis C-methylase UbiE
MISVLQKEIKKAELRILDCGAGTGSVVKNIAENDHRIFTVDIQPGMIHTIKAIKTHGENNAIIPIQADIRQLPIRPNTVDLILFIFILHHLPAPIDLFLRSANLLHNKGKIIVIDFLRHNQLTLADEMGDLWMGFDPNTFIEAGNKKNINKVSFGTFTDHIKLKSFYLVFEHQK